MEQLTATDYVIAAQIIQGIQQDILIIKAVMR